MANVGLLSPFRPQTNEQDSGYYKIGEEKNLKVRLVAYWTIGLGTRFINVKIRDFPRIIATKLWMPSRCTITTLFTFINNKNTE